MNERLNKACYYINEVVKGQNALIEQVANDYIQQNNVSNQRVTSLEQYVAHLSEEIKQKDQIIRQITGKGGSGGQESGQKGKEETGQHQQPLQQPPQQPQPVRVEPV